MTDVGAAGLTARPVARSQPQADGGTPGGGDGSGKPPWEVQARRVAQARASVMVLDQLLELFADGKNWVQNAYHDDHGRHCLVGGLEHVRARQGESATRQACI